MAIVLDGTANTVTPLNGALGATTPSTVVATTVVASSTIKGATTIAVGNATPSASGAGITFPATQSASTDANTLDDYEEGTWTPTQGGGLTVVGTFSSSGTYTKVGRLCTVMGRINGSTSIAFSAGNALICGGLPFTAINPSDHSPQGNIANAAATAFTGIAEYGVSLYSQGSLAATPTGYFSITYMTT
jgi:hypothetical protein